MNTTETQSTFRKARKRSVPILGIETADPAATIRECCRALNGDTKTTPITSWDIITGLQGLNEAGKQYVINLCNGTEPKISTGNPAECLGLVAGMVPDKLLIFWHNAQRYIDNEAVLQGVWNLRDTFKSVAATIVLLGPAIKLPDELKQDVMIISEALPEEQQLREIAQKMIEESGLADKVNGETMPVIVDTLRGLSAFAAEQVLAVSLTQNGVDLDQLWERKRKMIEQTPGLAVWQGEERFEDLGGLDNLKMFLKAVLTSGKTPVRAIGFIDEIEKGLAGSAGDTSGTSQDQLQVFLKVMQDLNIPGMILLGHPGCGKSAIAKAAGAVAGCPVISIDTGAMKSSLVGSSEARIRAAMDVFKAVSQGKGLFIATCNKIASLPPELRRRFTLGTFFVDLPSDTERKAIWQVWLKRYDVSADQGLPECLALSQGWTGAEIKACCDVAYRTGLPLNEAAAFVVPVIKSAPDQVNALRQQASGRFLDASNSGVYRMPEAKQTTTRKMEL